METPSSVKRLNNKIPISRKMEDSGNSITKSSRKRDKNQQNPLIDITNDSPIIGLANGSLLETPSSAMPSKQRSIVSTKAKNNSSSATSTPGSGEALLRGQVKTLLQKVEEEAEFSKLTIPPFVRLQGFVSSSSSPMGRLLAPTPENTPQVSDLSGGDFSGLTSVTFPPVVEEQHLKISQGKVVSNIFDGKTKQETLEDPIESQKSLNRTLLFDFSDKSDASSEDHHYKGGKPTTLSEDDTLSVWSVQVNLGEEEEEEDDDEEEEYYCSYNGLDELCEGMELISVVDDDKAVNKFIGKHSRFVYDSDDEEIVDVVVEEEGISSSDVLHLKGLPTPKGKHLRFPEEEEEE